MLELKRLRNIAFLLLCGSGAGCEHLSCERDDGAGPAPLSTQRDKLDLGNLPGLPALSGISDLTRDGNDSYYLVPERARFLLSLERGSFTRLASPPIPIEGIPDGLDTESIAWIDDHRIALGTESLQSKRWSDDIYIMGLDGKSLFVRSRIPVPYDLWNTRAPSNQGIEALCAIDNELWFAAEGAVTREGRRFAPFGRIDLASGAIRPARLALTTKTGKISALACRRLRVADKDVADAVEAYAIERHYGISRILRFTLRHAENPDEIEVTIAANLARALHPLPNLEGIAFTPQGDLLLVSDNDYGGVTGPTELIQVTLQPSLRP